jgi:hypothetical protein
MNPKGGGPPTPYMSKKEAWRATRNWFKRFSRRPDAVIVKNPALDPRGDNIKAVVEVKVGKTGWGKGQKADYRRIAGRKKLVVVNDKNCKCSPPPPPVPVMAEKPVPKTVPLLSPIAVRIGFAAALAAAVAVVAAVPVVATAAVAAGVVVLASGSPQGAGGTADAI